MNEPRRKVLYIDDDEGLGALVRRNLGRRGYDVTLVANGEAGLDLARKDAFDLIALDHYMPGQGGLETLVELRRLPDPPPIVYVTGSDESRVAVSALKAGAADYVVKSVGEEFFDLLDSAFRQAVEQVEELGIGRLDDVVGGALLQGRGRGAAPAGLQSRPGPA